MDNKEKDKFLQGEVGEDATKYGEFISSYFAWTSIPKQKKQVEELENMTKEDDSKTKENEDKRRK